MRSSLGRATGSMGDVSEGPKRFPSRLGMLSLSIRDRLKAIPLVSPRKDAHDGIRTPVHKTGALTTELREPR